VIVWGQYNNGIDSGLGFISANATVPQSFTRLPLPGSISNLSEFPSSGFINDVTIVVGVNAQYWNNIQIGGLLLYNTLNRSFTPLYPNNNNFQGIYISHLYTFGPRSSFYGQFLVVGSFTSLVRNEYTFNNIALCDTTASCSNLETGII
jgi:hypothetical protein